MTRTPVSVRFVDLAGREWEVSEIPRDVARRLMPQALIFEDPTTVPLMFASAEQQRLVAHAPAGWFDLSFTALQQLLRQSTPRRGSNSPGTSAAGDVRSPVLAVPGARAARPDGG